MPHCDSALTRWWWLADVAYSQEPVGLIPPTIKNFFQEYLAASVSVLKEKLEKNNPHFHCSTKVKQGQRL